MRIHDKELWARAEQVERQNGDDGPKFVAERIGALVLRGYLEGVATWKAIAAKLDALRSADDLAHVDTTRPED